MPELTWFSCIFVYLLLRWSSSPPSSILPLKYPSNGSVPNFENFKLSRKPLPPRVECVLRQPLQFRGGGWFHHEAYQSPSAKKEVATLAKDTLLKVCGAIGNSDIEPFIPAVVSAIANPTEVTDCVYKLAGTTFVQVVGQIVFFFNFARAAYYLQFCKSRSTKI